MRPYYDAWFYYYPPGKEYIAFNALQVTRRMFKSITARKPAISERDLPDSDDYAEIAIQIADLSIEISNAYKNMSNEYGAEAWANYAKLQKDIVEEILTD